MVNCPNCGTEVAVAVKCWTVTPMKHRAGGGYIPAFRVGIFVCPKCRSKFRAKVDAEAKPVKMNVRELAAKAKAIQEGLTQTLQNLREKIMLLETTERTGLLVEIDKLKNVAESRANALETEVNQLREELRFLREFLGESEETD